jgi:hypothetical protein
MTQKRIVSCNKSNHLICFLERVLRQHDCYHFGPHEFHSLYCGESYCRKMGPPGIHGCKCVEVKEDDNS